uniref:Tetraspanin n=1 Tax=Corethrella appendiculata TaxID=1370023 RepID=U5EZJ8_9DIPT
MGLTGGANFIKYMLFLFNFLFVITGIILLSVGLTVQGVYHGYSHFLEEQFFTVPKLLIAIGSIIFVIAFFGCCGAYKENYCMVLTFSVLLIIVFILELAAGISGYVLRNETAELITQSLNQTMPQYLKNNTDIIELWDQVQGNFDCCGLSNPVEDWKAAGFNATEIPMSCCRPQIGAIGVLHCPPQENEAIVLRKTGCVQAFGDYIKSHAVSLGAAGIILAIIQFAGIFFACYLLKQLRNQNYLS